MSKVNYRVVVCGLVVIAVLFLLGAYSGPTVTHTEWQVLRAEADEDPNTAINSASITRATAGDWDSKPTDANGILELKTIDGLSSTALTMELAACAGSAADKTFTVKLWTWAPQNGMAQLICSIDYVCGTQQVVKYPHTKAAATSKFWADTATVTPYWYSGKVGTADADGGNGVAVVKITLYGTSFYYAEVSSADGSTGTEAGDVMVYYRLTN